MGFSGGLPFWVVGSVLVFWGGGWCSFCCFVLVVWVGVAVFVGLGLGFRVVFFCWLVWVFGLRVLFCCLLVGCVFVLLFVGFWV